MSVISAVTLSSTIAAKGGKGGRTYTSKYRVVTDSQYDNGITINLSGILPVFGQVYQWYSTYDYGAFALWPHDCQLERGDDQSFRRYWIVTVKYETPEQSDEKGDQSGDDPTAYPWEVSGDGDEWTDEATKDQQGKPIVSSSLEPFKGKVVQVFKNRERLTLTKNFPSCNRAAITDCRGSVNASSVKILGVTYPARTLYMRRLRWSRAVYAGGKAYYFPHTFEIDVNTDTHDLSMVDMGHRRLTGNDPADPTCYSPIVDQATQRPIQHPVPLDGNGGVLQAGAPAVNKTFRVYKERPWAGWGFPP